MRENASWLSLLASYVQNGWELRDILSYDENVRSLSATDVRDAARKYLDEKNYVSVSLYPAGRANGS
jgi:predicted Zn-dependent peptidase